MPEIVDSAGHRFLYPQNSPAYFYTNIAAIIGGVIAVVTLINLFQSPTPLRKLVALVVWVLLPPTWFWLEYFWLFKSYGLAGTFEQFKYGQDVSSKVWAGILALLTVDLIRKNDDKPDTPHEPRG